MNGPSTNTVGSGTIAKLLETEIANILACVNSVLPLREAGLINIAAADASEVLPGISYLPAPDRDADSSVVRLAVGKEVALFVGDLVHKSLQVPRRELSSVFGRDMAPSRATPKCSLHLAAEENALVYPSRFDGISVGRVMHRGKTYAWKPALSWTLRSLAERSAAPVPRPKSRKLKRND